jgi:hypothetical protein
MSGPMHTGNTAISQNARAPDADWRHLQKWLGIGADSRPGVYGNRVVALMLDISPDDDSTAGGERLRGWKMSLLNRASAATGILKELTASGMDEGVGTDHPVHAAITCIRSHSADADRLRPGAPAGFGAGQWQRGGNLQESLRNPYEALRGAVKGGDRSAHLTAAIPRLK